MIEHEPPNSRPVFVVGAPRSGTSLMKRILQQSGSFPRYAAESKLLSCRSFYGDLDSHKGVQRFCKDFLRSQQFKKSGLDATDVENKIRDDWQGYPEFLGWFMDAIARSQGSTRWLEKTPGHVDHIQEIAAAFPDAAIIHMIRDGRDVALSSRKLGWAAATVPNRLLQLLWAGIRWEDFVSNGMRQAEEVPAHIYTAVRFEDLVLRPRETLSAVSAHCQLDLGLDAVSELSANSAFGSIEGLSQAPVARWQRWNDQYEISVLEHVIGGTLLRVGYHVPSRSPVRLRSRALGRVVHAGVTVTDLISAMAPSKLKPRRSPLVFTER